MELLLRNYSHERCLVPSVKEFLNEKVFKDDFLTYNVQQSTFYIHVMVSDLTEKGLTFNASRSRNVSTE